MAKSSKNDVRVRIHTRTRLKLRGSQERPRLAVFRSLKHIYAQVIDDRQGHTLVAASSSEKKTGSEKKSGSEEKSAAAKASGGEKKSGVSTGGNLAGAQEVGKLIAERAKSKGINKVVFDRGGYLYHGRVKALADAARAAGLEF
jgi:large subunit ribosomal protein L18